MAKIIVKKSNPLKGKVKIDGAKNAAILACQILAVSDKTIENKMYLYKKEMAEQVLEAEKKLLREIEMA